MCLDISKFTPDARITVVTHGWNDGYYEEGLLGLSREWLTFNE